MRYVGSKGRLIKYLKPFLEKNLTDYNLYIEPFVGGGNSIVKINHHSKIGYDIDKYSIGLLNHVLGGNELPRDVSYQTYMDVKNNKFSYPDWFVGFCGYCCSFGGKFFGGYARDSKNTNYAEQQAKSMNRNYADEQKRQIESHLSDQNKRLMLFVKDYRYVNIPDGSVVYCDPPYEGTQGYGSKFDHEEFWDWIRDISKDNYVYVSEFNSPDDFKCIWKKERAASLDLNTGGKKNIEKLFVMKNSLSDQTY